MIELTCEVCGAIFREYASQRKGAYITCSYKCSGVIRSRRMKGKMPKFVIGGWNRGKKLPQLAGKNNPRWSGGKHKLKTGYVVAYAPGNHNCFTGTSYALEHRLVMEQVLGRPLKNIEVIHHINGIRDDNRPENLEVYESQSKHIALHDCDRVRDIHGRYTKSD